MEKIKVIQVGTGGFGNTWLTALKDHPDGKIIALVDKNEEILYKQATACGIEKEHCYLSLSNALKKERADVLVNVTPPQIHKEICLEGFEAGLDVVTEKPLADAMESAIEIVNQAKKNKRKIMVSQNYRFTPWAWTVKDLLKKKSLGETGYVNILFQKGPHFGGFREEMPFPLLIDMSIHHFDLMRYFLDSDPVEVYTKSYKPDWSWFKGDPSVNLIFTFENGVACSYNASWIARGLETVWNGDWRIDCDNGVIVSRDDRIFTGSGAEGSPQEIKQESFEFTRQRYSFHEMVCAIRENREPQTNAEDNLKSLAMVFGAVESAKSNKVEKIPCGFF